MINAMTLEQIAEVTQAELFNDSHSNALISTVSKDTRTLNAGDLYLALTGENFDGHQFVSQAFKKKAAAALVETVQTNCPLVQIKVANSLLALGQLAGFNREQFTGPVVAVTGSAGKTTVKQLMASVLAQQFNTLMTAGNLNNHIGVPLTLLAIEKQHTAAVIELGASAQGEIAYSAQWVKPQVGIITNAAPAHIAGFGSLQNIVQTKGELLDFIQPKGTAILNADDEFFPQWQARVLRNFDVEIISFGCSEQAEVRAQNINCTLTNSSFELLYQNQTYNVRLPLLGEHNVSNALAVAAAGFALNMSADKIVAGLEAVNTVAGRLQWLQGSNGQKILNDAYNASPASIKAAIKVLKNAENNWLVLGDMAELGADAMAEHQAIGHFARQQGIQKVLATGELSKNTTKAFGEGAHWFATKQELVRYLQHNTQAKDVILVKGSRSAGMEEVVTALQTETKEI